MRGTIVVSCAPAEESRPARNFGFEFPKFCTDSKGPSILQALSFDVGRALSFDVGRRQGAAAPSNLAVSIPAVMFSCAFAMWQKTQNSNGWGLQYSNCWTVARLQLGDSAVLQHSNWSLTTPTWSVREMGCSFCAVVRLPLLFPFHYRSAQCGRQPRVAA